MLIRYFYKRAEKTNMKAHLMQENYVIKFLSPLSVVYSIMH